MHIRQLATQSWLADFALAIFCSATTTFLLVGFVGVLRWHEWDAFAQSEEQCSITHCVNSWDGRHILLTYWKPDGYSQSLHYGLATLDLQSSAPSLQPTAGAVQPRLLTRVAGNAAYVADRDGRVAMRRIDNGCRLGDEHFALPDGCPSQIFSSSDGKTLVSWVPQSLDVFDVPANQIRWQRQAGEVESIAFHPQAGLFASLGNRIVQLSLETGEVLRAIARHRETIRALAIDAQGVSIAWLDEGGNIEVCRLRDAKWQWLQKAHGAQILPGTHRPTMFANVLSFSPDGQYLVTSADEGEWVLGIWNAKTGDRVRTLRGHDEIINGARFLPDGTLASWGKDGTLRIWNVKRGTLQRVFDAHRLRSEVLSAGSRQI
jgi:hypothetical protein